MAKGCPRCVPDRHTGPQEQTTFRSGEVFKIQESVFTPIEHIFADMKTTGLTGQALHRSQTSLHSICTQGNATHKSRPCILLDYVRDAEMGITGCNICLMCTFEKTPIENLPLIFRHFCVQVYTENAAVTEDAHLHSLPDWPLSGEMQWVIVWQFDTTRGLLGRWRAPKTSRGQRRGMAFGSNAQEHLMALCGQKYREWKDLCASQPGFAAQQEHEYRQYKKTWKSSTVGSRTASCGSRESMAAPRWPGYDAQSIVSQTIFEDKVSVFGEKTQYATCEPGARGPESVRPKPKRRRRSRGSSRKSNTCSLASVNDGASVCGMGPKQRSPTREAFNNLAKRLAVVAPWGTA